MFCSSQLASSKRFPRTLLSLKPTVEALSTSDGCAGCSLGNNCVGCDGEWGGGARRFLRRERGEDWMLPPMHVTQQAHEPRGELAERQPIKLVRVEQNSGNLRPRYPFV